MKRIFTTIFIFTVLILTPLNAASFFSGFAGGKLNYSGNETSAEYEPNLKLQAFFSGQYNISKNIWSHMEFSLDTENLLSETIFHETESIFQIDELSLIFRNQSTTTTKYYSIFMGTYDPVGSDIFLQRYFGSEPVASKITESWLGLAGSILYPHFGIGFSDIVVFNSKPMAAGFYIYVNHEDEMYYVFNADGRFGCTFRYFTADIAGGVGIPFVNDDPSYKAAWQKENFHLGTTLLFGNNYTQSFFLQAGIYDLTSSKLSDNLFMDPDDTYILLEPRFVSGQLHFNFTFFSLPQKTVDNFLFVDDTLGFNFNVYTTSFAIASKTFTLGAHASLSLPGKSFNDLFAADKMFENGFNLNLTPYLYTNFLSGELHSQLKIKFGKFSSAVWQNAISIDIGFRTSI